jgi:iron(III) transport system ATP-binding protein
VTQPNQDRPGLVIEDLNVSFGDTPVLKGVNLKIEQGEFFAFLGPSGSGKSTLLRAIAGFGPPPTGRILIDGRDIADQPPWKRDVGMVFQSYALWPHMTVRRNVAFGLEERRLPKREIHERVDRALERVGLLDLAERRPSQLSGGQQQRVALARTVVVEPKVLLLDEPLSNLDANLRIQMRREIRELQQKLGLTTIFVTHDQEEANTTSDRMAVLDQGVVQQVGSPMALYDRPANLFVARFLGATNVLEGAMLPAAGGGRVFRTGKGVDVPLQPGAADGRYIIFRPQNVDVRGAGGESAGGPVIGGVIHHTEFLGSIIRYGVEVAGDSVLVDHAHRLGEQVFRAGDRVELAIDSDGILVLDA